MSTYSEAWLMNESLNFYLSTNTFNNPIFDARVELSSADPGLVVNQPNKAPRKSSGGAGRQYVAGRALALRRQCSKFCDNLGFSVRSKLFVLELNLRRKVDLVKGFVGRRLATNKPQHSTCAAATMNHAESKAKDTFWSPTAHSEELWVPKSRRSLGLQQGKILSRLEAKRRISHEQQLFNMDLDNNCGDNSPSGFGANVSGGAGLHHSPNCASQSSSSSSFSSSSSSANESPLLLLSQPSQANKAKSRRGHKGRWCRSRLMADLAKVAPNHLTNSSTRKLCIICYSNPPNIVTMPCKHDEICSDCFIELIYMAVKHSQFPLKCVLCRQKIERIRCSRRLLLSVIEKNRNYL